MEKTYQPENIEQKWYAKWEAAGYFSPRSEANRNNHKDDNYSIVIPPPNVTGSLHMGHAFQDTIMDCLIRYHRMLGKNTLWQPGTDHAGIATQMLVERKLHKETGQTKHDLGREAFIDKIWDWKAESGGNISNQLRRLGASADWTRERFTMDEGLSNAVQEVFVRLFEEGLIYRGKRLVNWDPVLKTAISDLEVENKAEKGHLYHVRYPFVDKDETFGGGFMHIATTRPETILADGCLAVHPDDERYTSVIGKFVHVPMTDRTIPIVTDPYPDPEFGTGCVKITPAHDFNDYEVGQRQSIEIINLFNDDASMNNNAPPRYQGMDRFTARKAIIADLDANGFLEKVEDHDLMRPYGDRSGTVIEPYLTNQWYVKAAPLAEPAIKAVENGEIQFVPKQYENMYFAWMRDIQDWCISRQLWWGHRIPAWYDDQGNVYVGRDETSVRDKHGLSADITLKQDEDVLDTWFSSALWTFSTMGWPEKTADLRLFHPTNTLVTGFDIIFFWVARMIMMTLHFIKDDDGKPQVPFKTVYVTGLIRDENGNKMSKSKGNVLDPLDMIDGIDLDSLAAKRTNNLMQPQLAEKIDNATRKAFPDGIAPHGTDALRFTLAALASTGRDINWDMQRLTGYRNFCNKLWNASRFVLMKTETFELDAVNPTFSVFDQWIDSKFNQANQKIQTAFEQYRFDVVAKTIYEFIWHDYCDWYLELTKPILASDDSAAIAGAQLTLLTTLEKTLRLIHPLMPFISEEIWQSVKPKLHLTDDSLMITAYPAVVDTTDAQAVTKTEWLQQVLIGIRQIRSEMDIAPSKSIPVMIENASATDQQFIQTFAPLIQTLGKLTCFETLTGQPPESAIALVGEMKLHIPLAGLIDKTAELERLQKAMDKLNMSITRLNGQLGNEKYVANAPAELVTQTRQQRDEQQSKLDSLTTQYAKISAL